MFTLKNYVFLEVTFLSFLLYSQMVLYAAIVTVGIHQQIVSARVRKAIKLGIVVISKIFGDIKVYQI